MEEKGKGKVEEEKEKEKEKENEDVTKTKQRRSPIHVIFFDLPIAPYTLSSMRLYRIRRSTS